MSSFNETIPMNPTFQVGLGSLTNTSERLANSRRAKVHKEVIVKNTGANALYVGKSDVSATNGFLLKTNEQVVLEVDNPGEVWVISTVGGTTYTWLAY